MKRRVLAVTVAILLAVLGTIAVLAYVHQANKRAVAGIQAETVVVASTTIPAGTKVSQALSQGMFTNQRYPVGSLPSDPVYSIGSAQGNMIVNSGLQPGGILLKSNLVTSNQYTGASSSGLAIPNNEMAVTVQVCLSADVGGYIQPGARVSLFNTFAVNGSLEFTCTSHQLSAGGNALGRGETQLVLKDVKVLAVQPASPSVGQTGVTAGLAAADPNSASSTVTGAGQVLVTIAVTEVQAKWLILVDRTGDPTFGLLAPGYTPPDTGPAIGPPMPPALP